MQIEIIVSTYNSPKSLELSIRSIAAQTLLPDSVCIADDGSGPKAVAAINTLIMQFPDLSIRHVWHEDTGFEKTRILNKTIATSNADYLIFIDGDCLMHPDFVARHVALAKPNRFLCGALIRLGERTSQSITGADINSAQIFSTRWLRDNTHMSKRTSFLKSKPWPLPVLSLLEVFWPMRRSWGGGNASAYRDAIMKVNGFDESMKYFGEDKEFGVRLQNSGIRGRLIRFTAPLLHLEHKRGYVNSDEIEKNKRMIADARRQKKTWVDDGIVKDSKFRLDEAPT